MFLALEWLFNVYAHLRFTCSTALEPRREKTCFMPYADNKGTDQPAHPRSQGSTFVVRSLDNIIPVVAMYEVSRV